MFSASVAQILQLSNVSLNYLDNSIITYSILHHRHSLSFPICKMQIIMSATGRTMLKNTEIIFLRICTVIQSKPVREMSRIIMLLFL